MNKYSFEDKYSYCLGMSLTVEALKHRYNDVKEVILSNKANKNNQLNYLLELCEQHNVPYSYDDKTIEKLSLKENCYCIGVFNKFKSELKSDNHIVLYGFNNYGDLGTILRSAVSFNFKDIVLVGSDIDYFHPTCVRVSMGSIFHTNIIRFNTIEDYIKAYPKQNLYPFTSSGNIELKKMELKAPFSIILSEDYKALDNRFKTSYYLAHNDLEEISLSIRSSITLSEAFFKS